MRTPDGFVARNGGDFDVRTAGGFDVRNSGGFVANTHIVLTCDQRHLKVLGTGDHQLTIRNLSHHIFQYWQVAEMLGLVAKLRVQHPTEV